MQLRPLRAAAGEALCERPLRSAQAAAVLRCWANAGRTHPRPISTHAAQAAAVLRYGANAGRYLALRPSSVAVVTMVAAAAAATAACRRSPPSDQACSLPHERAVITPRGSK